MTALTDGHVRLDERGVADVGGTGLKLIHPVMAYQEGGESIEAARTALSGLSPADAYAALAYYFDHQAEVDRTIEEYHERAERMQAEAGESPMTARLRENRLR